MQKVSVAILGIGTVGGGSYDILTKEREMIKRTQGIDIVVKRVLDKGVDLISKRGVDKSKATTSIDDIVSDKDISIVIETMGGVEPARSFILSCLKAGKSIVTANKELLAKHGKELEKAASENAAGLYYEASVAGGIPIVRVLEQGMQANNIVKIFGIVNGTTNFILTKMAEEGLDYKLVLKEAQELGFAEADPTADVDGFDSMYKLSILSSMAFHECVCFSQIYREGITKISASDIQNAKELGYIIKLLAIGQKTKEGIEARVHPTFVKKSHPLASVRNEFNAVFLSGDSVDDIMLYGRGAGSYPTASAIVSDVIFAVACQNNKRAVFNADKNARIVEDFFSNYYLSIAVHDRAGVLAKITDLFAKNGVSISQMIQKEAFGEKASLVFLTHTTKEFSMRKAISMVEKLKEVYSVESMIRVLN